MTVQARYLKGEPHFTSDPNFGAPNCYKESATVALIALAANMADAKAGALQAQLQSSSLAFQKLEAELTGIIEARQRLDSQQSENELVLKEFALLKSHNTVYKLVGPSLVPQEQAEAKGNVEKRLEFIKNEIKRVEVQLKESQEKVAKKRNEVMGLQQQFQALQGPSAGQAVDRKSVV